MQLKGSRHRCEPGWDARQRAERRLKEAHDKREQDRAQAALLRAVNRIHAATGR